MESHVPDISPALHLSPEALSQVHTWRRHFNGGEYFDAHEVLESPWLAAQEPGKTFLKGLIHAAVALLHYERGNAHGARVKYASCQRYLRPFGEVTDPVDVRSLLQDLERFFKPLLDLGPTARTLPDVSWRPVVAAPRDGRATEEGPPLTGPEGG